jgi:hypothetical protein
MIVWVQINSCIWIHMCIYINIYRSLKGLLRGIQEYGNLKNSVNLYADRLVAVKYDLIDSSIYTDLKYQDIKGSCCELSLC